MSSRTTETNPHGVAKVAAGVQLSTQELPTISIVVPSYNQGPFLEETICSILDQHYPKLELIVRDGGSKDNSVAILRKYESSIAHLAIGPDGGQSDALCKGFAQASGEILAWLNSDDAYCSDSLWRVGRFFAAHPRHMFCFGDVQEIDPNSRPVGLLKAVPSVPFLTRHSGAHGWWQPGCFWRRTTYEACGGIDASLFFCMDRDLFIRICSAGRSACLKGAPLARFRVHGEQKSQVNIAEFLKEDALMFKRYSRPSMNPWRGMVARCFGIWRRLVS